MSIECLELLFSSRNALLDKVGASYLLSFDWCFFSLASFLLGAVGGLT